LRIWAHAEEFDTAIRYLDASLDRPRWPKPTDIWRGQSLTDASGAVQASLDFAHESGVYLGALRAPTLTLTISATLQQSTLDY